MNSDLVLQLVEVAISMAQSQSDDAGELSQTLLDIIEKGRQAYEQHTGELLDPLQIQEEEPI
jgi:hypothetical protein